MNLHTCGSNVFFEKVNKNQKFYVIFIEGDNSYVQSKADLENSLKHLSENGIIILYDINRKTVYNDKKIGEKHTVYRTFHEYQGRKDLYKDMGIIDGKNNNKLLDS